MKKRQSQESFKAVKCSVIEGNRPCRPYISAVISLARLFPRIKNSARQGHPPYSTLYTNLIVCTIQVMISKGRIPICRENSTPILIVRYSSKKNRAEIVFRVKVHCATCKIGN